MIANDLPVTVWNYISESGPSISASEFGHVLRELHSVPEPADFQLPKFSPMPKVESRLDHLASTDIPEPDLTFLRERFHQLSADFARLDFELPPGPIHGDAHPGNLMRSDSGVILVIDLEDFCYGPREWDAAVMSLRAKARTAAFTPEVLATPLAKRPYDLRHAAVSTWLNAGVEATRVAVWAGHSVAVLLRVYAKCLDGGEQAARAKVQQAMSG